MALEVSKVGVLGVIASVAVWTVACWIVASDFGYHGKGFWEGALNLGAILGAIAVTVTACEASVEH